MNIAQGQVMRIAIIGAGFSGTALAATLHRYGAASCDITLFDKSGRFGVGDAYRTPYPFHLLNVRASDMSAFEDDPDHYVRWLQSNPEVQPYLDKNTPIRDQYTPRILYGTYLKQLLDDVQLNHEQTCLRLEPSEVVDVIRQRQQALLVLKDGRESLYDHVVFALGNHAVQQFPFPVSEQMRCILYPWDYLAPSRIKQDETVMIVGTGLSMIDTVLTLYHQGHQGKIYAVSRHGLLPLAHADSQAPFAFQMSEATSEIRQLTKFLRRNSMMHHQAGGDWRAVINAVRTHIPALWARISVRDKKQFMRHLLPYWNIHRHRVNDKIAELLQALIAKNQLEIISGHVQLVDEAAAIVKWRKTCECVRYDIDWLINCMGPSNDISLIKQPLLQALIERRVAAWDDLKLGFEMTATGALKSPDGHVSPYYVVGPARRGLEWEAGAVPEIRKQTHHLALHLLKK